MDIRPASPTGSYWPRKFVAAPGDREIVGRASDATTRSLTRKIILCLSHMGL